MHHKNNAAAETPLLQLLLLAAPAVSVVITYEQ